MWDEIHCKERREKMIEILLVIGLVLMSIGLFLINLVVGFIGTGILVVFLALTLARIKAVTLLSSKK